MGGYDAVVVGSGPNGLAAAITVARAGGSVILIEGQSGLGGGTRTEELTLPGYRHDVCSAVHPLALSSPFFRSLPLDAHGLAWTHPRYPLVHPTDDGRGVTVERDLDATADRLGRDGSAYRKLFGPLSRAWPDLIDDVLGPVRVPRRPVLLARFGLPGLLPASALARVCFRDEPTRALFAGLAGHAMLPLESVLTSAFGLLLGAAAHAVGWPFARGGSQRIADALASYLRSLGGEIVTGRWITTVDELPAAKTILLDVTPRQLLRLAGHRMPARFSARLRRYRYGMAAFKLDWALDGPIPWTTPDAREAGTVHLGWRLDEIAGSERAAWAGENAERPFVLLAQPTAFDRERAPAGGHVAWAYCHVPHNSADDMTARIEAQIERFAPGFARRIVARSVRGPADLERNNPNLVGGDINGGVQDLWQAFFRPTRLTYGTPAPEIFLCSAATPPGGGVHGMGGFWAAQRALKHLGFQPKRSSRGTS